MKKYVPIIVMALLVLMLSGCGGKNETFSGGQNESVQAVVNLEDSRILIAYFSLLDIVPEGADATTHATPMIGNTEYAAMELQKQTDGDLFAIRTVQSYPVLHSECSEIAQKESREDARPELSTHMENMEDYDIIFLGYPLWWYEEPMAVRTFLEEYDFSGKTIVPFCTSLGASVGKSEQNIQRICPDSVVMSGVTLHSESKDFSEPISEWLTEIGLK